jgi:hypothetical protein
MLVRELRNVLPGRFPNGVNVAVGDVDADNYDDLIVSAGAGREPIITAISGRDIVEGVADPATIFTFVAPGGRRDGAKVAVGYVAPSTVPSYYANLVTTPELGRNVGTVSVWNTADLPGGSNGMPMGGMPMGRMPMGRMPMGGTPMGGTPMGGTPMPNDMPSTDEPVMPVTTFRPFGASRGAVNLATTYQRQLGGQAQAVVAAWQLPREVVFAAIGLDNKVQTVKRRF